MFTCKCTTLGVYISKRFRDCSSYQQKNQKNASTGKRFLIADVSLLTCVYNLNSSCYFSNLLPMLKLECALFSPAPYLTYKCRTLFHRLNAKRL